MSESTESAIEKKQFRAYRSTIIRAPVESTWNLVRDFVGIKEYFPVACIIRYGDNNIPGCHREVTLGEGIWVLEELLDLSDKDMKITYKILDSTFPLTMPTCNYVASMSLKPITTDNWTFIEWYVDFNMIDETQSGDDCGAALGENVFVTGFNGLKKILED